MCVSHEPVPASAAEHKFIDRASLSLGTVPDQSEIAESPPQISRLFSFLIQWRLMGQKKEERGIGNVHIMLIFAWFEKMYAEKMYATACTILVKDCI